MRYDYEIVMSPRVNLSTAGEMDLKRKGAQGFRVKNTWTEQDNQGNTIFIFLLEKEIS